MVLTVRLDRKTQERLVRLARDTGKSRSEIVREALRLYTPPVDGTRTAYQTFADIIGSAHLGGGARARRSEEILRARFARRSRPR